LYEHLVASSLVNAGADPECRAPSSPGLSFLCIDLLIILSSTTGDMVPPSLSHTQSQPRCTMSSPITDLILLSNLPPNAGLTLSGFASTHAPPALIRQVWATLELLRPASPLLSYSPAHFTLLSSDTARKEISSDRVQSFLEELTRASFEVATSLLCSSVLAGRTSESDDYGDVGIWIGPLAHKEPKDVLRRLGLDEWVANKGGKVRFSALILV
jgi:hypothetical protein